MSLTRLTILGVFLCFFCSGAPLAVNSQAQDVPTAPCLETRSARERVGQVLEQYGLFLYREARRIGQFCFPWTLLAATSLAATAYYRGRKNQKFCLRVIAYGVLGYLFFYTNWVEGSLHPTRGLAAITGCTWEQKQNGQGVAQENLPSPYLRWTQWIEHGPAGLRRDSREYLRWVLFSSDFAISYAPPDLKSAKEGALQALRESLPAQLPLESRTGNLLGVGLARGFGKAVGSFFRLSTAVYIFARGLLVLSDLLLKSLPVFLFFVFLGLGCLGLPAILWAEDFRAAQGWFRWLLFFGFLPLFYAFWGSLGFELLSAIYQASFEDPRGAWHRFWHWSQQLCVDFSWKKELGLFLGEASPHLHLLFLTLWYGLRALFLELVALLFLSLFLALAVLWVAPTPLLLWFVLGKIALLLPGSPKGAGELAKPLSGRLPSERDLTKKPAQEQSGGFGTVEKNLPSATGPLSPLG